MSQLNVLLDGKLVATLDDRPGQGLATLTYTDDVVAEFAGIHLLSLRLPVRSGYYSAYEVKAWMDGLLPEGDVRTILADRVRLDRGDLFGLLRAYGRDCAGAVTVVDPSETPDDLTSSVRWLSQTDLEEAVRNLPARPLGVGLSGKARISLGGVQGKLAVVLDGDRVGLPEGLAPSTHILKPTPFTAAGTERYPGIVTAEAMCMRICHHLGLEVPEVSILDLATGPAFVVKRYDRSTDADGRVSRLHQEDFAQALGITSVQKYQEDGRDVPSLLGLREVLAHAGAGDLPTLGALAERVAVYGLVTNCDAHAKNWSLLLLGSQVRLAPVYDVVPSALWPDVTTALALRVGDCGLMEDLRADDVREEWKRWGLGVRALDPRLERLRQKIDGAVDAAGEDVIRMGGDSSVAEQIAELVSDRVRAFF
jgi:serine/threonine-protein kinase HipA